MRFDLSIRDRAGSREDVPQDAGLGFVRRLELQTEAGFRSSPNVCFETNIRKSDPHRRAYRNRRLADEVHTADGNVGREVVVKLTIEAKFDGHTHVEAVALAPLLLLAANVATESQDDDIVPAPEE